MSSNMMKAWLKTSNNSAKKNLSEVFEKNDSEDDSNDVIEVTQENNNAKKMPKRSRFIDDSESGSDEEKSKKTPKQVKNNDKKMPKRSRFIDDTESGSDEEKSKKTPKQVKKKKTSGTPAKIEGKTIEQHRRSLGDQVKSAIHVEKWCIKATTHVVAECGYEVFKALVAPNCSNVFPEEFNASTEIVLGVVESTQEAAAIFGATKIKGGTRLGSWSANKMDLVFRPKERELRVWWTMK